MWAIMDEDFVNVDVILFQKHLRPNRETLGGRPRSPMGVPLLRTHSLSFAPVSVVQVVQFVLYSPLCSFADSRVARMEREGASSSSSRPN